MGKPLTDAARRLVATRIALGFETPAEFARVMKMSQGHLSDFESGKRNISLGFARKLKKRFGLPLDWTLDGDAQFLAAPLAKKIDLAA
jgi:transcriptional regulator with XRE-family HTH domain